MCAPQKGILSDAVSDPLSKMCSDLLKSAFIKKTGIANHKHTLLPTKSHSVDVLDPEFSSQNSSEIVQLLCLLFSTPSHALA